MGMEGGKDCRLSNFHPTNPFPPSPVPKPLKGLFEAIWIIFRRFLRSNKRLQSKSFVSF